MTITIKEVREAFAEWNKKAFGGELPEPSFELMHTRSLLGQFKWQKISKDKCGYTIRISTYYDRPYNSYIDTIVHEMLHFYIKYKGIKDTSSHGREWKRMAKQLSNKFGLTITRTNPVGGGISEAVKQKKALSKTKHEYVIVCRLNNSHKYGAAVLPVNKLDWYRKQFEKWPLILTWKIVLAPWAETFDLRHLHSGVAVRHIKYEQYKRFWQMNGININ